MLKRLLLTAILTIASVAAHAGTLDEPFDRTFDVRPGAVFSLSNVNGHINIRAWDQPKIHVHAVKHVESRDGDAARSAMKALTLAVSQPNGGLRIDTKYPKSSDGVLEWIAGTSVNLSVTYEVMVPRSMNLQIENTNGTVEASDITGSHRVETTNGHIKLARCAGDLDAETTNGGIEAELTSVTAGHVVRLETTNGGIHARLPRKLAASLDASTTNGGIESDLAVATRGKLDKHSLRGTINGGGPDLRMRTTNGSIHIQGI